MTKKTERQIQARKEIEMLTRAIDLIANSIDASNEGRLADAERLAAESVRLFEEVDGPLPPDVIDEIRDTYSPKRRRLQ
jgi:hypothetical protein